MLGYSMWKRDILWEKTWLLLISSKFTDQSRILSKWISSFTVNEEIASKLTPSDLESIPYNTIVNQIERIPAISRQMERKLTQLVEMSTGEKWQRSSIRLTIFSWMPLGQRQYIRTREKLCWNWIYWTIWSEGAQGKYCHSSSIAVLTQQTSVQFASHVRQNTNTNANWVNMKMQTQLARISKCMLSEDLRCFAAFRCGLYFQIGQSSKLLDRRCSPPTIVRNLVLNKSNLKKYRFIGPHYSKRSEGFHSKLLENPSKRHLFIHLLSMVLIL